MECGCHVDDKVGSLAVQEQKFLIVRRVFGWKGTLWREKKNWIPGRWVWNFLGSSWVEIVAEISRLWETNWWFWSRFTGWSLLMAGTWEVLNMRERFLHEKCSYRFHIWCYLMQNQKWKYEQKQNKNPQCTG